MTRQEIEHMWKVASNDPNHDYNWHDPVVIAFANLVAQHEREACAKECEHTALRMGSEWMAQHCAQAIRARGDHEEA